MLLDCELCLIVNCYAWVDFRYLLYCLTKRLAYRLSDVFFAVGKGKEKETQRAEDCRSVHCTYGPTCEGLCFWIN